ncbi:protein kinase C delta type-like [Xenopus laevis]|uniref:Protein kinase C delta type-like n=1 Tax=Xenopus laevis TaxID=8355 RepID=A0A8J1M1A6_XENLA|nr:protein kinase C delta type-like [Xenopus laevis]XP_041435492.1 protein kinase C delta type-like [Xenopus laevis]
MTIREEKMKTDKKINREPEEPAKEGRSGVKIPCIPAKRPNPKKLRNYQFHMELGKGNFGKVMLATLKNHREQVAVKVIQKKEKESHIKKILAEARTLKIVKGCPFLCRGYAAFQSKLHAFLVMEWIRGGDLQQLMNEEGQLKMDSVRFYSAEMIVGIQYLHSLGIVHRDLKPANILISAEGHIRIADFGLVAEEMFGDTKKYNIVGTLPFMAPEILSWSGYGAGVDWWAFAIILCKMATRRNPFNEGLAMNDLVDALINKQSDFPEDLNPDLKNLLQQLLEKNPDKRLGTTGDIRQHQFYRSIDWNALERRKIPPPFQPRAIPAVDFSAVCKEPPSFLEEMDCINASGGTTMIQDLTFLSPSWEM